MCFFLLTEPIKSVLLHRQNRLTFNRFNISFTQSTIMAEKKATKAAAPKAAAAKKETEKKTAAPKKVAAKKAELAVNAENAGFKAGDVYNALAAAEKALTVAEIAKKAKISNEEAILGLGWLLKEGKVKAEDNKVALA